MVASLRLGDYSGTDKGFHAGSVCVTPVLLVVCSCTVKGQQYIFVLRSQPEVSGLTL